jgi:hypothetical protein
VFIPWGGVVTIRWATHSDGCCHARDFYDANKPCKGGLLALSRQISVKGVVGKQPENGHRLYAPYDDLYELKPGDFRFMGFRSGRDFYLTNGALKAKRKEQERDYKFGLEVRAVVLQSLSVK